MIVALIAIPIRVDAYSARWTAGIGLGLLVAVVVLGRLSYARFGRSLERFHGPLLEQLLPLPDQTSVLRRIMTAHPGILALLVMIGLLALVRLLRLLVVSGLLGFVAFFAFVFLLVWGLDPHVCATGAAGCSGAFANAGAHPSIGDFVYLATQSAFFNVPGDLSASSRVARAALTGEFVAAAALLAGFATSLGLLGWDVVAWPLRVAVTLTVASSVRSGEEWPASRCQCPARWDGPGHEIGPSTTCVVRGGRPRGRVPETADSPSAFRISEPRAFRLAAAGSLRGRVPSPAQAVSIDRRFTGSTSLGMVKHAGFVDPLADGAKFTAAPPWTCNGAIMMPYWRHGSEPLHRKPPSPARRRH